MKSASLVWFAAVLACPVVAFAQPGPSEPPAPPAGGAPAPPPDASQPPPPMQPQPPAPPPPGYAPPPPGYALVPVPPAGPATPWDFHKGFTIELDIGVGFAHASSNGNSDNSDGALAGLDLSLGGFISPQLALTFRAAGVQIKESGSDQTAIHFFGGPAIQYWPDPHFFVGGGAGLSIFQLSGCDSSNDSSCSIKGFGLDARAGASFGPAAHQFNVSVELNPGFYSQDNVDITITGVSFLLGYQYL